MDFCQESETVVENNENKNTQGAEETALTLSCPDERSERNHVCCLLGVSDLTLEEDERAIEFAIGTGWEEAVHGWGRTSPTACIWSRKKIKRGRVGEGSSSNSTSDCLFCMSLSQGSLEVHSLSEVGKPEASAVAEVSSEKNWSPEKSWENISQRPSTASREPKKLCLPTYMHGEKKSLQIKEFIWCMEEWAMPETVSGKTCRSPCRSTDRNLSISSSLTSKALVVLPPLQSSTPNSLDVLSKKNSNVFWQPEEKAIRVEKDECEACTDMLKTVDGKGEKRHFELASCLKVTDILPFPPPVARTQLLAAESSKCCLHWSLLPQKSSMFSSSPANIHYLATLQLLHKQRVQSSRTRLKAKEPRHPRNIQKHILTESKQENSSQALSDKMFPKPLLPSLTVSRVVIPVSTHRVL
ncbi:uncharacterized protein C16orf46 homolog isoform X1 [Cricetulus griseus]|uniref:Uncharacterized protein C16orf46 homolog isoform X1 n=1 Tax=Cricetulus griseus TaxID=10029 RepID=A0A9J7FVG5_CRIGR|nr:uncharacterized protein C16orf46 homolog isoform X1 [Cricetulus griseus]XP_027266589.1 uncharacterized protein C16orf46 homolog isoform X1 [Cricetulus griseus]XP_027266590.1 uncharacterized protein C16orf46 homolog isoform X1 [Cricetulus griseus]XP_027266591.1 uncharacterized protein C16orf46 homolog isoform X1 [Cricetulus griseus]XP_027266592.1 uncharacterized protein C16orf46 homolog isoform X1 [Cricetulus griseus]XP_035298593.1 uncharacterized protein C16orf46 homolog isoform X1 [Cricetu